MRKTYSFLDILRTLPTGAQILNGILQLTIQGMAPKNMSQRSSNDERKRIEKMELFRKTIPTSSTDAEILRAKLISHLKTNYHV
jgi:hypothetical protein